MLDIKQIKPKGKDSDKYSINLYRYLKKHPTYNKVYFQAMKLVQVGCDENHEPIKEYQEVSFDINDFDVTEIYLSCNPEWYIEKDGAIVGRGLLSILRGGRGMYENFCIGSTCPRKYIDITESFWNEYINHGRCIWGKSHTGWLANDENRFTYINEENRKCNWCGEVQHREIKEESIIKRTETWVANHIE